MKRSPISKISKKRRRVAGREKLYGADKTARRREIFERSGGKCEAIVRCSLPECNEGGKTWHVYRCGRPITWETMEWSHKRHGPNKDDSLDGGIASCRECHRKSHAGGNGKPCPKKPKAEYVSLHSVYCDCSRCKERQA